MLLFTLQQWTNQITLYYTHIHFEKDDTIFYLFLIIKIS
jgi:hypothetical protein